MGRGVPIPCPPGRVVGRRFLGEDLYFLASDDFICTAPLDCILCVKVPVLLFLVDFFELFFGDLGIFQGHLFDFFLEAFDLDDFFFDVCGGA